MPRLFNFVSLNLKAYRSVYVHSTKIMLILGIILIQGCNISSSKYRSQGKNNTALAEQLSQSEAYFRMAKTSKDHNSYVYKLFGVHHLILAEQYTRAEHELATVKLPKNPDNFWFIVKAELSLAQQDAAAANSWLQYINNPRSLSTEYAHVFYSTRAKINLQLGNIVKAATDQIQLQQFLTTEEQRERNSKNIFHILNNMTPSELIQQPTTDHTTRGWLQFTALMKRYDANSFQRTQALTLWQQRYPKHAANRLIGGSSDTEFSYSGKKLNHIALLLPLQGQHAKSAANIRDGFLAAYYKNARKNKPQITILDTEEAGVTQSYQQAIGQGADIVIGPLIKEDVDKIARISSLPVPVLALNQTEYSNNKRNLLQFSLAPELESQEVAAKAWTNGFRLPLIIVPNNPWGERVVYAFNSQWEALGGIEPIVLSINSKEELASQIKKILLLNESEARATALQKLGIKFQYEPRRRQDIDMVFLATKPTAARQLKPMLSFFYAKDLTTFAISSIYTGQNKATIDQDLNGINFCDIPWLLDPNIDKNNDYHSLTANVDYIPRLYAFGIDAYNLAYKLETLAGQPELGIPGMTGTLKLNSNGQIYRNLMWATFKNGIPKATTNLQ